MLLFATGLATIIACGSLGVPRRLGRGPGDVRLQMAAASDAIHAVVSRCRADAPCFLVVAMGIGSCIMLPLYLREPAQGAVIRGGVEASVAMAYTAVFPTFIACRWLNRGVAPIWGGIMPAASRSFGWPPQPLLDPNTA